MQPYYGCIIMNEMNILDRTMNTANVREVFGMSIDEMSQMLGSDVRSIKRWEAGETYPQKEMRQKLTALFALELHLKQTFKTPEAIRIWLRHESPFFGEMTALDVLRAGRLDRVEAALEALDSEAVI